MSVPSSPRGSDPLNPRASEEIQNGMTGFAKDDPAFAPAKPAPTLKARRGFAILKEQNPELLTSIARKGGQRAHEVGTAHKFTSDEAKVAGAKGGRNAHANRRARTENVE